MPAIAPIAEKLGLKPNEWLPYGHDKAKIDLSVTHGPRRRPGEPKLILVSAITPTPAGEGKTTTTVGLGQGLARIGESVCLALRQPSLGPSFGLKGGAAGGGMASLTPLEDIDLHFTGDFHAITSAHNLLASIIDNHLHFHSSVNLDPRRVTWKRVLDLNDRALRHVTVGLGGASDGVPRETGFDITAASEVMAMLCLAEGYDDLRKRIDRTIIGQDVQGKAITAGDLKATGAMMALLKDALLPNLVQTLDGVPALVHGGPFANIAHGCNSVVATKTALNLADWVVTEAGFAFDLGGEKFYDIKCRGAGLDTAAVVLVATTRALRMHGGGDHKGAPDAKIVEKGLGNLQKHIESIQLFGETPIVALNRFANDDPDEIAVVARFCDTHRIPFAVCDAFARGAEGAIGLARMVVANAEPTSKPFIPLYPLELAPIEKIRTVARTMYGARDVIVSPEAMKDLKRAEKLGLSNLPVCMAKTQNSLSDDPTRRGRPEDFDIRIRRVEIAAGAGFLVVLTGDMVRMPGLPEVPLAERIDMIDGRVVGLK